jgi:hypothetical protein
MAENFYPNATNFDLGYYVDDVQQNAFEGEASLYEKGISYWQTASMSQFNDWSSVKYSVGDPCGDGTLGQINTTLQKLFIFLRGVQKYSDLYINGTINKIKNLQGQIKKFVSVITGVLRSLVQRTRNWILNYLRDLLTNAVEKLLPPLLKQIKDSLIAGIIDQIFCAFEDIIKSLFNLVADFLYSLIGQIINVPFCAAEQWTNALINKLVNTIDSALDPIFDQINNILSGVAQITGSVSSAINTILGFQGFLCSQPECPELKEFQASLWAGPSPTMKDNFNKFGFNDSFIDESSKTVDGWLNDFFGPESNSSQSPGSCYTGTFECGIPQIVIFGGGGSGAVAQAVVNNIGQVIGANLITGGQGYISPPFVSIVDPANCGNNASAFSIYSSDNGTVTEVVINNPGSNYNPGFNGGLPVISTFVGAPNPINVGNSVILTWAVSNADSVSLGIPGYTDLPLVGSASLPIREEDVYFAPGSTRTTLTYTLSATKQNIDSGSQSTSKNFILTVLTQDESGGGGTNSLSPVIESFSASPGVAKPGELVTLSWNTTNTTSVSLDIPGYSSVPQDGSISVVIPADTQFPSNGQDISKTYTLTASNSNAPSENQNISDTVTIRITKPDGTIGTGTTGGADNVGGGTINVGDETVVIGGVPTSGTDTSGTGNNNAIAVIGGVDILNTGIGYTSGDFVVIDGGVGGSNGATASLETNGIGQIVSININSSGYGFTQIPTIAINSREGIGAQFRVKLDFIPINQFIQEQKVEVDPNKLVQIIDCVTR